jgi:hypothetical protein
LTNAGSTGFEGYDGELVEDSVIKKFLITAAESIVLCKIRCLCLITISSCLSLKSRQKRNNCS